MLGARICCGPMDRNRISVGALGLLAGILLTLALAAPAGAYIYWAEPQRPAIARAENDGSGIDKNFITAAVEPCGVALDSGHVYWVDLTSTEARIGRSSLDGGFVQAEYVKIGAAFPCGVAVYSASIFWSDIGFFGGGTR